MRRHDQGHAGCPTHQALHTSYLSQRRTTPNLTNAQDSRRLHMQVSLSGGAGAAAIPMSCKVAASRSTPSCPTPASHTLLLQVLSSEFWPRDLLGPVEDAAAAALHPNLQKVADAFTEQVGMACSACVDITRHTHGAHVTLMAHTSHSLCSTSC